MALQQQTEVAEATVESRTALLRASSIHGGEVSESQKMYFLKVLSRKKIINSEQVDTTFEAKLSGCTPPELSYCATLLLRRKLVLDAMVPPRCFKQTGAVLKAATLAALSKFCENTALVLEFLGGFVESQRNRKPPGFLNLGE